MKLNTEKVDTLELLELNSDCQAHCCDKDGFKKLMVLYRHSKPVWAHRDCLIQKEENPKKGLTKGKKRV